MIKSLPDTMKLERKTTAGTPSESWTSREKIRALVGIFFLVCVALFIQIGTIAEEEAIAEDTYMRAGNKVGGTKDDKGKKCPCSEKRNEKFHGDLLNRKDLLDMASTARDRMIDTIKEDYGEYFDAIFVGEGKGYASQSVESTERLKRKLMIKVLRMQTEVLKKGCEECTDVDEENTFVDYVWATGGHSSAAGHGNLFNESYTAVLGRDARMVFEAIGVYFDDRNYAMGGTSAGLEISMCWEQIFGSDVDFFSWDYGMTDGNKIQALMHYGYRGGISPGRPAFMGRDIGGRTRGTRQMALNELEALGMAVSGAAGDETYTVMSLGIPDSSEGLTQEQINTLPRMVRNFKCGTQYFESGDPFCGVEKYSKEICPRRGKQAAWHPGFKSHALDGHALALFITGALIDAISDLVSHPSTDPSELLAELLKAEDVAFESLRNGDLGARTNQIFSPGDVSVLDPSLDLDALWKKPSLCRTGRTPSQTRYLGYAANSDRVGGPTIPGSEEYDTCVPVDKAAKTSLQQGGALVLACGSDHEVCEGAIVKPDYKDFFYTHSKFGWASLSIPNDKEREAYGYDPSLVKGFVLLSFSTCDWGRCSPGDLKPEDLALGKFEMKVNGKAVTEIVNLGAEVIVLKGGDGFSWKPNDNGVFELAVRVKEDNGYVRISSIILY